MNTIKLQWDVANKFFADATVGTAKPVFFGIRGDEFAKPATFVAGEYVDLSIKKNYRDGLLAKITLRFGSDEVYYENAISIETDENIHDNLLNLIRGAINEAHEKQRSINSDITELREILDSISFTPEPNVLLTELVKKLSTATPYEFENAVKELVDFSNESKDSLLRDLVISLTGATYRTLTTRIALLQEYVEKLTAIDRTALLQKHVEKLTATE